MIVEKITILVFNATMFYLRDQYKKIFFGFLIFAVGFLPQIALAGFGVSPPQIENNKLVPGSHFETKIFLVQGAPLEDIDIKITLDSKEMKDWISFDRGFEFTIPAGVQQYPLNVIIDVPQDAPFNIYRAFIRINTDPTKARESGQVAISVGARVDVELVIGDDIISSYLIKRVEILDIKGKEPLKVNVTIENTGNVPSGPEAVSFDLFNSFQTVRLAFIEAQVEKEIPSFTTERLTISFPLDFRLAPGEYWATVRVHNEDGKTVNETKSIFNVHEGDLPALSSSARIATPTLIVVFAFLLTAFFILRRSFRSSKRGRRVR